MTQKNMPISAGDDPATVGIGDLVSQVADAESCPAWRLDVLGQEQQIRVVLD